MRHLKIKAKLLAGFALMSLLALIVGLIGTIGLISADADYTEINSANFKAGSALADIRENFLQQRVTLRSLILDAGSPEKVRADAETLKSYDTEMRGFMAVYEAGITDRESETNYFTARDAYFGSYALAVQNITAAAERGDYEAAAAILADSAPATAVTKGMASATNDLQKRMEKSSSILSKRSMTIAVAQAVVMLCSAACAMGMGVYISSLISTPIKTLSGFFTRFGTDGDLGLSDEDKSNIAANSGNRDEIGQCISGAAKMYERMMEINETLGSVAGGDLTARVRILSDNDSLGLSVTRMIDSLNSMLGELRAASTQVTSGAGQISHSSQELAAGASQQAASIEEFSSTLAGMQEKTRKNAENSVNAAKVNEEIGVMLDESVSSMAEMLEAMKAIDEGSKSITRVIKVIDDIAFQTNILALNAAVEAARAGIHGKGFAVVADEVRNLASKSAAAAKETAALIEGSSQKVIEGNQIVDKTNASLEAVSAGSKEVIRLIGEVSVSSTEQAEAITELNHSIEQISGVVQENSASAEESAAASEEMSTQAAMLDKIAESFKLKQDGSVPATGNAHGQTSSGPVAVTRSGNAQDKYD